MPDEKWVELRELASRYDQRLNATTGEWKHRLSLFALPAGFRLLLDEVDLERPWSPGRPPTHRS